MKFDQNKISRFLFLGILFTVFIFIVIQIQTWIAQPIGLVEPQIGGYVIPVVSGFLLSFIVMLSAKLVVGQLKK